MRVFISYHRADTQYRRKTENILRAHNINFYVVPENANFNGQTSEYINTFLCSKLRKCNVLLCLIGNDTYSRPHVDREIHEALKGVPGKRLGIIGVHLPSRNDTLQTINLNTYPIKLWDNKDYVVWTNWVDLNANVGELIEIAIDRSHDSLIFTNHSNDCLQLRKKIHYDN